MQSGLEQVVSLGRPLERSSVWDGCVSVTHQGAAAMWQTPVKLSAGPSTPELPAVTVDNWTPVPRLLRFNQGGRLALSERKGPNI